jgi:hypothetical protein
LLNVIIMNVVVSIVVAPQMSSEHKKSVPSSKLCFD